MGDELNKDGAAAEQAGQEENRAPEAAGGSDPGEKKYTDADVDRIVSKRLARERAKKDGSDAAADLDKREHELEIRERRANAREELDGLPKSFIELVNCESEESYKSSVKAVRAAYDEIRGELEKERAAGRTPKNYGDPGKPDRTADAFGLKR